MVRKDRTFIDAIKNYYQSNIEDTEKHDTEVENMVYIDKLKHLLVMERDAKRFKVYNSITGEFLMSVSEKTSKTGGAGGVGGAYIAADYVHIEGTSIKWVATTQNNNTINFYESANYLWRERLSTSEIQLCRKYLIQNLTLFSEMVR